MTLSTRVEYAETVAALLPTRLRLLMGGLVVGGVIVAACAGDDDVFRATPAQLYDASTSDRFIPVATAADAATPSFFCGDAAGAPERALVVSGNTPGELAAVNLDTGVVDGRFFLDGGAGVTSVALNADPWIVDQKQDLVIRLDPQAPWRPLATWNVRSNDGVGVAAATPVAVAQVSCTKAYVPRFGRNRIAIINPSAIGTDAVPTGFIDLGSYVETPSGTVDMTSAIWVPTKKRVYVLAGNVNHLITAPDGTLGCSPLAPSIFAIDPATDALVSLGGKGLGGSLELNGIDPPLGTTMVYDPAFDRLLVLTGGCTPVDADGGAGPVTRRLLEQVDLASGTVTTLLDLSQRPRPTGLALLDPQHALLSFGSVAMAFDSSDGGAPTVIGGVDRVSDDGRGNFLAARHRLLAGGGAIDELFEFTDAGAQLVDAGFFSAPASNIASLEPWPHR